MAKIRLTNDSLNSYGTRILTSGVDISQYEKNPVLLYMHNRGIVIGIVENIEKTDKEITGELKFDEATELSRQCKQQYEFGSLRMVSVGIEMLEQSTDKDVVLQGQRFATITKSRLFEVSLVDIGANPDAIRLKHKGKLLNLADGDILPSVLKPINMDTENKELEQLSDETIRTAAGVVETEQAKQIDELTLAYENKTIEVEQLQHRVSELEQQISTFKAVADAAENQMREMVVDKAIADGRITPDRKAHFLKLGKALPLDDFLATIEACQPRITLASQIEGSSNQPRPTWDELDRKGELLNLKQNNIAEFKQLYKERFGAEYIE